MKKTTRVLKDVIFCVFLYSLSILVKASEVNPSVSQLGAGQAIRDVVVGLSVVVAAIFVLAWVVRRMGATKLIQQNGMKVVSSMPLSAREKIVLIEVFGKRMLIGVAPGSVSFLCNVDGKSMQKSESNNDDETIDNLTEETWDFSKYIKKIISDGPQK